VAAGILWRVEDGVGHIVIDRPHAANALDSAAAEAFAQAVGQAADADIGCVLISAVGPQFCAGGDIREFAQRRADLDRLVQRVLDRLHPAVRTLAALPLPVVSAVQGPVGGAGIAVALCADIVLASGAMKLRGGYSAIGLSPDLGASWQLARRAGAARAKYLLMTNRAIDAQTCLRWGLVYELHPPEALADAARALALQLARGARGALGGIKRLCDDAPLHELPTHLDLERQALLRCAAGEDGREGVAAFVDRREPRFTDKRIS